MKRNSWYKNKKTDVIEMSAADPWGRCLVYSACLLWCLGLTCTVTARTLILIFPDTVFWSVLIWASSWEINNSNCWHLTAMSWLFLTFKHLNEMKTFTPASIVRCCCHPWAFVLEADDAVFYFEKSSRILNTRRAITSEKGDLMQSFHFSFSHVSCNSAGSPVHPTHQATKHM